MSSRFEIAQVLRQPDLLQNFIKSRTHARAPDSDAQPLSRRYTQSVHADSIYAAASMAAALVAEHHDMFRGAGVTNLTCTFNFAQRTPACPDLEFTVVVGYEFIL